MTHVVRPKLEKFLRSRGKARACYGRRKTGKTYYARRVLDDYKYFIALGRGRLLDPVEGRVHDWSIVKLVCGSGVIVDEFHRLGEEFFAFLQSGECLDEELVLLTSTLHYFKRLAHGPDAPLAGLFQEMRVSLLSPVELLAHKWGSSRGVLETLVFYQEPSLIGLSLEDIFVSRPHMARALVGEVLSEEDKLLSRRYLGVLEAVASGMQGLSEVSTYLYNIGLLDKPSTSLITPYVEDLLEMGLLERVRVYGKKRKHVYRLPSPFMDMVFYLESRYAYTESMLGWRQVENIVRQRIPLLIEVFVEKALSELCSLAPIKILEPQEVDVALARFTKPVVAGEVKWAGKLDRSHLRRIEAKLESLGVEHKFLFLPREDIVPGETGLTILDYERLATLARRRECPWHIV